MGYKYVKRTTIIVACLLAAVFNVRNVQAQISPSYDAYADAVASSSGVGEGQTTIANAQNAVGAPDGNSVGIAGIDSSITLDMGQGEEGTGKLTLYSSLLQVAVNFRIEFLDSNSNVIKSDESTLAISTTNTSEYNFNFSDYSKAYRYVRITNLATGVFNLDAIEAANYIGMSAETDTDNGGVPDREENTDGTNPQDPSDDITDNPTTNETTPNVTTQNTDTSGTGEEATTTSTNETNGNVVGTCTDLLADEMAKANAYLGGILLLLLLLILALIAMMYYRNKYHSREKPVMTTTM